MPMIATARTTQLILWFEEIGLGDVPLVGGMNASLGETYNALSSSGVRVPNGFAVTAEAYRRFLSGNGLERRIAEMLRGLNTHDTRSCSASTAFPGSWPPSSTRTTHGIDSISLNPDSALKTTLAVLLLEDKLGRAHHE